MLRLSKLFFLSIALVWIALVGAATFVLIHFIAKLW